MRRCNEDDSLDTAKLCSRGCLQPLINDPATCGKCNNDILVFGTETFKLRIEDGPEVLAQSAGTDSIVHFPADSPAENIGNIISGDELILSKQIEQRTELLSRLVLRLNAWDGQARDKQKAHIASRSNRDPRGLRSLEFGENKISCRAAEQTRKLVQGVPRVRLFRDSPPARLLLDLPEGILGLTTAPVVGGRDCVKP